MQIPEKVTEKVELVLHVFYFSIFAETNVL